MEARSNRPARSPRVALTLASILFLIASQPAFAQHLPGRQHVVNSQNFIVFASSPQWAAEVSKAAEQYRRDLAIYWLGEELPPWSQRCPVHVTAGANLGASGETRFSPIATGVGNWMMSVNGTPERILDSVLPHEISHTIFATHFADYAKLNRFVPRWADEGACTTVEHESEKKKHRHYLRQFLQTGRGLAFNQMFLLKDYPPDILPLYAQGHSAVQFLIDQSSPRDFIHFLEQGMQTGAWEHALRDHYDYESIGEFQSLWNKWLFDGSPVDLLSYAPRLQRNPDTALASNPSEELASATPFSGNVQFAIGNSQPAPVMLASNQRDVTPPPAPEIDAIGGLRSGQGESWYKRRMREVNETSDPSEPPVSQQATSRPQPAQSTDVQVLELGNSIPISGAKYVLPRPEGIHGAAPIGAAQAAASAPASAVLPAPTAPAYRQSVSNPRMVPIHNY